MITLKKSKLIFLKKFSVIYVIITFILTSYALHATYDYHKQYPMSFSEDLYDITIFAVIIFMCVGLFIFSVYAYNYLKNLERVYSDFYTQGRTLSIKEISEDTELLDTVTLNHIKILAQNKKEGRKANINSTIHFE